MAKNVNVQPGKKGFQPRLTTQGKTPPPSQNLPPVTPETPTTVETTDYTTLKNTQQAHVKQKIQNLLNQNDCDYITVQNPDPFNDWKFTLEYEEPTYNGVAWAGILTHKTGAKLYVDNDGDGGCNKYSGTREIRNQYEEDSKKALGNMFEPNDNFVIALEIVHQGKDF